MRSSLTYTARFCRLFFALLMWTGCGGSADEDAGAGPRDGSIGLDGGPGDSGSALDAAARDSGTRDSGTRDSGIRDSGLVDVPAALAELPLNEWRAVSTNTIRDLDPCPVSRCAWSSLEGLSGVTADWTGGVYASEQGAFGSLIYWGGGHNGYYGNEVYSFDIATLTWERLSDPTDGMTPGDATTFGFNEETCRWWDGRPVSMHTYDSVFYEPGRNRFWLSSVKDFGGSFGVDGLRATIAACGSRLAANFDLTNGVWEDSATEGAVGIFGAGAWDSSRGLLWYAFRQEIHSFDPVADVWVNHGRRTNAPGLDTAGAIDPGRDLFVVTDFRGDRDAVYAISLADADVPGAVVTTVGETEIQASGGNGFEWAEELGGFVAYKSGRDVFLLTPPDGDYATAPWVWSRIVATGVEPDMPENGPYSKFQYVPGLGIAFVASRVNGAVFAIRLAP